MITGKKRFRKQGENIMFFAKQFLIQQSGSLKILGFWVQNDLDYSKQVVRGTGKAPMHPPPL